MAVNWLRRWGRAQLVFWAVAIGYLGLTYARMSNVETLVRTAVVVVFGTLVYVDLIVRRRAEAAAARQTAQTGTAETGMTQTGTTEAGTKQTATTQTATTQTGDDSLPDDGVIVRGIRDDVTKARTDLNALQKNFEQLTGDMRTMVETIADETKRVSDALNDFSTRLREDMQSVRLGLETTARIIASSPSIASLYDVRPAAAIDPSLEPSARRYTHVLSSSADYRASILAVVNQPAVVDDVEAHLAVLLQQSGDLYAASTVMRGATSPRMQAWVRDNAAAQDSLYGVGPLLRRLRRILELDGTDAATTAFLNGLRERELTAMTVFLVPNKDAMTSDQQVRHALKRLAEAVVRQWLTPTIRLYQLVHEALRIEDPELYQRVCGATLSARYRYDLPPALETFNAAANALGFQYIHHELYVADPFSIRADVGDTTPRYSFWEWIAGEASTTDRRVAVERDCVGRVNTPRFETSSGSGTINAQITIIMGER